MINPQSFPTASGSKTAKKLFKCLYCHAEECLKNKTAPICHDAIQCWKSHTRESKYEYISRGCTTNPNHVTYCGPINGNVKRMNISNYFVMDCCTGEFCNDGPFPELPPYKVEMDESQHAIKIFLGCCGFILGICLVVSLISLFVNRSRKKRAMRYPAVYDDVENYDGSDPLVRTIAAVGDSTLKEYLEHSITSGSGYGLPLLMKRTLAKQILLAELIGKGKYGEVWRGVWNGENVAVKIFLSKDEASWSRESEIYGILMLRHENILGYIGSDMTSLHSCTHMWLITRYHAHGSLYDYINRNVLDCGKMLKLCSSLVNGLVHLHSEIRGDDNKPGIAHRDIKSKNILVNSREECVLADFGLAVTHLWKTGETVIAPNPRVGTKRYMSPEILDESINMSCFEAFKKADIYALGLVFWEVCRRTATVDGVVNEYQPPFYEYVSGDPSFEDMRKVVCVDEQRPVIPDRWINDPILKKMVPLIIECWHQNHNVRLPVLRVKKYLVSLSITAQVAETNKADDDGNANDKSNDLSIVKEKDIE